MVVPQDAVRKTDGSIRLAVDVLRRNRKDLSPPEVGAGGRGPDLDMGRALFHALLDERTLPGRERRGFGHPRLDDPEANRLLGPKVRDEPAAVCGAGVIRAQPDVVVR